MNSSHPITAGAVALALLLSGCATAGQDAPARTPAGTTAPPAAAPQPTGQSSSPSATPLPAVPALTAAEQADHDERLIRAVKANDLALATQLVEAGADVNARDSIDDSAFLYAGAEGFTEILQLTLAHDADVASTNRFGGTALIPASEHGHTEAVRILIAAGTPVNHVNNMGWTAMQEAVLLGDGGPRQQDVVRQLLDAGADPDISDPDGCTALANAQRLGFAEIARTISARVPGASSECG